MVTLFANMLRLPYYKHVMGSSTQQFTDIVVMVEQIELGIKSGRISTFMEKKGFERKRKEFEHFEDDYKGTKNLFQDYHHHSSQIVNISSEPKDQLKNFPKINLPEKPSTATSTTIILK